MREIVSGLHTKNQHYSTSHSCGRLSTNCSDVVMMVDPAIGVRPGISSAYDRGSVANIWMKEPNSTAYLGSKCSPLVVSTRPNFFQLFGLLVPPICSGIWNNHCKQRINTRRGYAPCTGRTPVPPRLGYKDKRSWGSSGYGQPPDGVLPCVGEVPGWCMTPGYDTYTGCTQTHHLTYTDRATRLGYVAYTFGVAPSV